MRGKYRTANIILTVILILALAFHIFTASVIGMTEIDSADWNSGQTMELTGEIYAEKIGPEYQGNKRPDMNFIESKREYVILAPKCFIRKRTLFCP